MEKISKHQLYAPFVQDYFSELTGILQHFQTIRKHPSKFGEFLELLKTQPLKTYAQSGQYRSLDELSSDQKELVQYLDHQITLLNEGATADTLTMEQLEHITDDSFIRYYGKKPSYN